LAQATEKKKSKITSFPWKKKLKNHNLPCLENKETEKHM